MREPEAIPLTAEILGRFAAGLRTAGAPLGDLIQPGLSDEQIDELGREVGVSIPPELRTLWRWGAAPSRSGPGNCNWAVLPDFDLWPPADAVRETGNYRLDPTVSRTTIAFGGPTAEGYLLVEAGDAATSEVIYAFIDDPDTLTAAPSLGALFTLWGDLLARGDYRYIVDEWAPFDDGPDTWFRGGI